MGNVTRTPMGVARWWSSLTVWTNFRVCSAEDRQWMLTILTDQLQALRSEAVTAVSFRTTVVPSILELELVVARDTFTAAEEVGRMFVHTLHEQLRGCVEATEMSTGIEPSTDNPVRSRRPVA